jgi:hypothetical protein
MKRQYCKHCPWCKAKLQKNGTVNGKIRYRCPNGHATKRHTRDDLRRNATYAKFTKYLLSVDAAKTVAKDYLQPLASFRREIAWCWDIEIPIPISNIIHPYVMADAKGCEVGSCAILRSKQHILTWQYGASENSDLWRRTFQNIAKPLALVSDGQKGILKAAKDVWGDLIIQRCQVHVKRNIRVKLTLHPESEAGKDLAYLMQSLCKVRTEEDMGVFIGMFAYYCEQHKSFLEHKTYNQNLNSKKKHWFTHARVRSAYKQIEKLVREDQLFAYVTHPELQLPNTTNALEGGINAQLDELIRRHRGLTGQHQCCLISLFLRARTTVGGRVLGDFLHKNEY